MPYPIRYFKHRITIEQPPAAAQNASYEDVNVEDPDNFTAVETVWGRIQTLSADQVRIAESRRQQATHRIVLRHRTDLGSGDVEMNPKFIAVFGTRHFEIVQVLNEDFDNRYDVLVVNELT